MLIVFILSFDKNKQTNNSIVEEDISEGQTSFVAEVWVAPQLLEKGLSDGLSGVDPEPLGGSVPRYHLTVHILGGLPVKDKKTSPVGISAI